MSMCRSKLSNKHSPQMTLAGLESVKLPVVLMVLTQYGGCPALTGCYLKHRIMRFCVKKAASQIPLRESDASWSHHAARVRSGWELFIPKRIVKKVMWGDGEKKNPQQYMNFINSFWKIGFLVITTAFSFIFVVLSKHQTQAWRGFIPKWHQGNPPHLASLHKGHICAPFPLSRPLLARLSP